MATQGAILFAMLFNIHICPFAHLVQSFNLRCHQYTKDTIYILSLNGWPSTALPNLAEGLEAMAGL